MTTLLPDRPIAGQPARPAAAPKSRSTWRSVLALSRPGQWTKNVLVLSAPAAAGVLDQSQAVSRALVMILAFTAAAVSVYALNDVLDADADRAHPVKRHRPVADGSLAPTAALAWSALMAAAALGIAGWLGPASLGVVGCYLVISASYAVWLKRVAVLDIVVVASGFVLRALAGAVAVGLTASNWFLLISLFGALYLVVGKRAAEAARTPAERSVTRSVLAQYPEAWLQQVSTVALAGSMISYAMWAFQDLGTDVFTPVLALSVVPFLVALMRYGLLLAQGRGERPERLVLHDRPLLVAGVVWLLLVGSGLYLA